MNNYSLLRLSYYLQSHLALFLILLGGCFIYLALVNWRIFSKAGIAGWKSLIPILNMWCFVKIATKPKSSFVVWMITFSAMLLLPYLIGVSVPLLFLINTVYIQGCLAKPFGKGVGFAIGLALLYPVFGGILAFGKATHINKASTTFQPFPNNISSNQTDKPMFSPSNSIKGTGEEASNVSKTPFPPQSA